MSPSRDSTPRQADWPSVAMWLWLNKFRFLSDSDEVESQGGFSNWEYKDKNGACDLKTLIMCNIWSNMKR
jgi:hypothetical protein